MYDQGIDPMVWVIMLSVPLSFVVLLAGFEILVRRLVKADKMRFFRSQHVNELHKKIHRIVNFTLLVPIIIIFTMHMDNRVVVVAVIISFGFISEMVEAFFYWKYSSNRNNYLVPIARFVWLSSLSVVFFFYIMPTFFS